METKGHNSDPADYRRRVNCAVGSHGAYLLAGHKHIDGLPLLVADAMSYAEEEKGESGVLDLLEAARRRYEIHSMDGADHLETYTVIGTYSDAEGEDGEPQRFAEGITATSVEDAEAYMLREHPTLNIAGVVAGATRMADV